MQALSDFDFDLPQDLIAQSRVYPREKARLIRLSNSGIDDLLVGDIPSLLRSSDVLVLNDTKVLKGHIIGHREADNLSVSVNIIKMYGRGICTILALPGRKLKIGDKLVFGDNFYGFIMDKRQELIFIQFNVSDMKLDEQIDIHGKMPIPQYIKSGNDSDVLDYQTIFAKRPGSFAAPTAGLHFSDSLLKAIEGIGTKIAYLTLHVGYGTFAPVRVENIQEHKMHSEEFFLDEENADIISSGERIISVGTTSVRVLESIMQKKGSIMPYSGSTDIFIYPGYRFRSTDVLMTNFHLPKSTLFMLVCAFMGTDRMKQLYEHAVRNRYRFFSYGDSCWLESA